MKLKPALFLDRDGILNPDVGYPHHLRDAVLFDDVIPALRQIQQVGYVLLVVSNQSGVSRGLFDLEAVFRFNNAIARHLRQGGIRINRRNFYVCPHAPQDGCVCRKPQPGLLLEAARHHKIALVASFTIGDAESDVEAGRRAGTRTILLDRAGRLRKKTKADFVRSSLLDVSDLLSSARPSATAAAAQLCREENRGQLESLSEIELRERRINHSRGSMKP